MFIFGFFKWILIGIIAFIIVIMSSIRTSDWNFPKDEIINAYNTFLQNFCVAGLSKDKDIEGKRVFGTDKYVGTYKAEYDNVTSEETIFGGTALYRENGDKSTALMQVAHNYEEQGMQVLILKPQVDTKGGGELVSRLGVHRKADRLIRPDMDVFEVVREASQATKLACVLCDESQFFTAEQAEQLFMVTVDLNIPVICYGLRADFSLRGFPGSTRLLELAHTIEEMKTICTCGRKAICNCRKVNGQFVFEGEQVAIDLENDVQYVSMCPQCYFRARRAFYAGRK